MSGKKEKKNLEKKINWSIWIDIQAERICIGWDGWMEKERWTSDDGVFKLDWNVGSNFRVIELS